MVIAGKGLILVHIDRVQQAMVLQNVPLLYMASSDLCIVIVLTNIASHIRVDP